VSRRIGLPRFAEHVVTLHTWRKSGGFLARILSERRKAISK
jgi:hypothetical protein